MGAGIFFRGKEFLLRRTLQHSHHLPVHVLYSSGANCGQISCKRFVTDFVEKIKKSKTVLFVRFELKKVKKVLFVRFLYSNNCLFHFYFYFPKNNHFSLPRSSIRRLKVLI